MKIPQIPLVPQSSSTALQSTGVVIFTATLQLAGPVAGPVRIAPQFESFYTFTSKKCPTLVQPTLQK